MTAAHRRPVGRDRRAAVLAHFDADGAVAPHVVRLIDALALVAARVVVVSTSGIDAETRGRLPAGVEVFERANTGHDFAGYRAGIDLLDLSTLEELIVVNDSAVLPLVPFDEILGRRAADVWGLTPGYGFAPHLQSYFLVFGPRALASPAFSAFWRTVDVDADRDQVIASSEVGLGTAMRDGGLSIGAFYRPGLRDRLIGAARAHGAEVAAHVRDRRWRRVAGWARRTVQRARQPEWNVSAALADRALGTRSRLPAVKLSVLRDDPYGLGTPHLLSMLERRHPVAFDGVREYLARTDHAYADRWQATQRSQPQGLRYRA